MIYGTNMILNYSDAVFVEQIITHMGALKLYLHSFLLLLLHYS